MIGTEGFTISLVCTDVCVGDAAVEVSGISFVLGIGHNINRCDLFQPHVSRSKSDIQTDYVEFLAVQMRQENHDDFTRNRENVAGWNYTVNLTEGDGQYLRTPLLHIFAGTSYVAMRTVDDDVNQTYRKAWLRWFNPSLYVERERSIQESFELLSSTIYEAICKIPRSLRVSQIK